MRKLIRRLLCRLGFHDLAFRSSNIQWYIKPYQFCIYCDHGRKFNRGEVRYEF